MATQNYMVASRSLKVFILDKLAGSLQYKTVIRVAQEQ